MGEKGEISKYKKEFLEYLKGDMNGGHPCGNQFKNLPPLSEGGIITKKKLKDILTKEEMERSWSEDDKIQIETFIDKNDAYIYSEEDLELFKPQAPLPLKNPIKVDYTIYKDLFDKPRPKEDVLKELDGIEKKEYSQ